MATGMSILDKYGIKEVADVVFYEKDSKGAPSAPVLYLDTLKVSTIEQSAEIVDATGGKGNVKLISWDTNKEITATFEDALFSAKSLAIMFGGKLHYNGEDQEVLKTVTKDGLVDKGTDWEIEIGKYTVYLKKDMGTYFIYEGDDVVPVRYSAGLETDDFDFITFDLLDCTTKTTGSQNNEGVIYNGLEIKIDASTFGGTYYITGDTYARNYQSGKDEFLQFIIPKGKVSAEDLSLTMEADGDPATFSMNINVLRDSDGTMFKLVKYSAKDAKGQDDKNKGVASVLEEFNDDSIDYDSGMTPVEGSLPD